MFNPQVFFEAGRARSGVALMPILNSNSTYITISTRLGNVLVKWGDGVEENITPTKEADFTVINHPNGNVYHNYSSAYTGDISLVIKQGLHDVYSLRLYRDGNNYYYYNILSISGFLKQFRNLYSFVIALERNVNGTIGNIVKGDLSLIPDALEKIKVVLTTGIVNNGTDIYLDINNFSSNSQLKYLSFDINGATKISGDLHNLPSLISFFYAGRVLSGSSITYTAGKVWASNLETLSIPLPLTTSELDNLLIDLQNSVTSVGSGTIALGGYRSSATDTAVAYLQGLGRTVNIQKKTLIIDSSVIFRMDFQNNYDVYSNSLIDITSGNGVGSLGNLPTFALSGRKAGEYCAVFNGSQSIKTTTNLPINSDKVTIAFWMKTIQTGAAIVGEMSPNTNSNNTFSWYVNDGVSNSVQFNSRNTGSNQSARVGANNGTWKHFVAVIDRAQNGTNEILIYENGALTTFTKPSSTDNNGNFVNNILFIGQRAGSSLGFNGSLTRLKIYNYAFTPSEVSNLYNSEL